MSQLSDILQSYGESRDFNIECSNALSGIDKLQNWPELDKGRVALLLVVSSDIGCSILTSNQFTQFHQLLDTAVVNLSIKLQVPGAQENLAKAIMNCRNYA